MNMHKSKTAAYDLINELKSQSAVSSQYDILCIQEPWQDMYGNVKSGNRWRTLYPTSRSTLPSSTAVRSTILVNRNISTGDWEQIDIPNTNDVTALLMRGHYGSLILVNIYNDGDHDEALEATRTHLRKLMQNRNLLASTTYMIWAGDFNRHHPLWEDPSNEHLLTSSYIDKAEPLIHLLIDFDMNLTLPTAITTFQSATTGNWTRPDNVFHSENLTDHIISCQIRPELRSPGADHLPIETIIDLNLTRISTTQNRNFRAANWEEFNDELGVNIAELDFTADITNQDELDEAVNNLTKAIQKTITDKIPLIKPYPAWRRWWNHDLGIMKKQLNRLNNLSFKMRTVTDHTIHRELKEHQRKYGKAIMDAKKKHWEEYLENVTASSIYTAGKFAAEAPDNIGVTMIPTIEHIVNGEAVQATTNNEKARILNDKFFPPKPNNHALPSSQEDLLDPLPDPPPLQHHTLARAIRKLKPYKAPGPDEIPNVILQKGAASIIPPLLRIYRSILERRIYPKAWHLFTTVVIRKPGRDNYKVASAYRPIALLCTMAKVLSAIVTEDISYLAEKHQLLPANQFGGRPGRATTDLLHLLIDRINHAWRNKRVISILSLDIDNAFPNAVTDKLQHNLRKRRIPAAYVDFVGNLLHDRETVLRFGDYTSPRFAVNNGIGQGCPLSMTSWIFYNADFFDLTVTGNKDSVSLGFVDDKTVIAIGPNLNETTNSLKTFMESTPGGFSWAAEHNATFSLPKLGILHCSRRKIKDPNNPRKQIQEPRPTLKLHDTTVKQVQSLKVVGVWIDEELRWHRQRLYAISKATSLVMAYRRLARLAKGLPMFALRRLYLTVVIPKMTYGLSVWYTPPYIVEGQKRRSGSVAALTQFERIQRIALLSITGSIRTAPTDMMEVQARILPMDLFLLKRCHNELTRVYSLPPSHPLHDIARKRYNSRHVKRYPSPLHLLPTILCPVPPNETEVIDVPQRSPHYQPNFVCRISGSKEEAKDEHDALTDEIAIYTDGSSIDGSVGAAAILYERRRGVIRTLKYQLGGDSQFSAYDAEAVGIILGLHLARQVRSNTRQISINLDGKSVIQALSKQTTTSSQHLLETIHDKTTHLHRPRITFRWIPGHRGIEGNEAADQRAKEAAEGNTSNPDRIPEALQNQLPCSLAMVRRTFNERIKRRWEERFRDSPRHLRMFPPRSNANLNHVNKVLIGLPRQWCSLIVQLQSGHIGLNAHLNRIQKHPTPNCESCEAAGYPTPETVTHFLFECPSYRRERHILKMNLGRGANSLAQLLQGKKDSIKELVKYVDRTGRLKATFGELTQD
jgi:ribonuclease HI